MPYAEPVVAETLALIYAIVNLFKVKINRQYPRHGDASEQYMFTKEDRQPEMVCQPRWD